VVNWAFSRISLLGILEHADRKNNEINIIKILTCESKMTTQLTKTT
jgi:hypothetical protein